MHKLALTIGINYLNLTKNRLNGCINDALSMKRQLERFGYKVQLMTDSSYTTSEFQPTKENILREFRNILRKAADGDYITISFAGHGDQFSSTDGTELDGKDETILPVGSIIETKTRVPILGSNDKPMKDNSGRNITKRGIETKLDRSQVISDNEINQILWEELQGPDKSRPKKPNCKVFMLFDCCHSGTVGDLEYNYDINSSRRDEHAKFISAQIIMISGCRDNQVSADTKYDGAYQGAMTYSFLKSINSNNGNRAIQDNVFTLVNQMRQFLSQNSSFGQVPQISSSFDLKDENYKDHIWYIYTSKSTPFFVPQNISNNTTVSTTIPIEPIRPNNIPANRPTVSSIIDTNPNPNPNPQIIPNMNTNMYNDLAAPDSSVQVFSYTYNVPTRYNTQSQTTQSGSNSPFVYTYSYTPTRNLSNSLFTYTYRHHA